MNSGKESGDPFKELGWSDLEEWAGTRSTAKGEDYKRSGKVEEIKRTREGGLLARVRGRMEYITEVTLKNGKLDSTCTCPMGSGCKHGVATVLEYLDLLQHGKKVPLLSEEDALLIKVKSKHVDFDAFDHKSGDHSSLQEWLEEQDKAELIDILMEFSKISPALGSYLRDRQDLKTEYAGGIVGDIYSEIDELCEKTRYYDYWSDYSQIPDFSNVQARMESLLDTGHYAELIEIGNELMDRYEENIMEYDEEGEIGTEIADCMNVVFEALLESPAPAHERMLRALEFEVEDDYSLTEEHEFWEGEFSPEEWKDFAEVLKTRIQEIDEGHFPNYSDWRRNQFVDRQIQALQKAGLFEEAVPLCEREAEKTDNYGRLVEVLLDAGQKEKAEEWIYRGVKKTLKDRTGIGQKLRQKLLEIKENNGDLLFAAAIQTEEFFRNPNIRYYLDMKEKAENAGVWQEVRDTAHRYLEKGEKTTILPENKAETSVLPGVLPKTGLLEPDSFEDIKTPMFDLLIKIAIEEKAPDEVARWYKEIKKGIEAGETYTYYIYKNQIANAVYEKYPDMAIEIWKKIAEELIARTKVDAYTEASVHLRKIKETMEAGGQKKEWKIYLEELRKENKRKRRLMEILDKLETDRIIGK